MDRYTNSPIGQDRPRFYTYYKKKGHFQSTCRERMHPGNVIRVSQITGDEEELLCELKEMEEMMGEKKNTILKLREQKDDIIFGEKGLPTEFIDSQKKSHGEDLAAMNEEYEGVLKSGKKDRLRTEKLRYVSFIEKYINFLKPTEKRASHEGIKGKVHSSKGDSTQKARRKKESEGTQVADGPSHSHRESHRESHKST